MRFLSENGADQESSQVHKKKDAARSRETSARGGDTREMRGMREMSERTEKVTDVRDDNRMKRWDKCCQRLDRKWSRYSKAYRQGLNLEICER